MRSSQLCAPPANEANDWAGMNRSPAGELGQPKARPGTQENHLAGRREWAPHFWVGCDAFAWWRLLVRHRFAVHWTKWYVAVAASVVAPVHTALRMLQTVIFGRQVAGTRINNAPVFIIGHWRSGTTLLHELLT